MSTLPDSPISPSVFHANHFHPRQWMLVVALAFSPLAFAADEAIYLRAQHITLNQQTGASTYTGNVRLKRGDLSFIASRAVVKQRHGNIDTIRADGNPVVVKKHDARKRTLTTVSGQQLLYLATPNTIIVMGQVVTRQGSDVIRSAKLIYDVDGDTLVAEGQDQSRRVNAVFHVRQPEQTEQ